MISEVNKNLISIIVEGRADKIIMDESFKNKTIRTLLYTIDMIEVDRDPGEVFEGGNKGIVLAASAKIIREEGKRILCIIDRDGEEFNGFSVNEKCYMTDLSSVEIYPFSDSEVFGYIEKVHGIKMSEATIASIISVARIISAIQWIRLRRIPDRSLVDFTASLSFDRESSTVSLDVTNWLTRSASNGGAREGWLNLRSEHDESHYNSIEDWRECTNVHALDQIMKFWLRHSANRVSYVDGWLEGHLRGIATADKLDSYDFFQNITARCIQEINEQA